MKNLELLGKKSKNIEENQKKVIYFYKSVGSEKDVRYHVKT